MHKRKHRKSNRDDDYAESPDAPALHPCLYIHAHEADVIRGKPAVSARFLEYQDPPNMMTTGDNSRPGLIPRRSHQSFGDADTAGTDQPDRPVVWLDRYHDTSCRQKEYDVRLLLDHWPNFQSESTQVRPSSPSGWSDLPSDCEDTFFFSPDELEDYRRDKRRRLIERGRQERLRALATTDGQVEERDPDPWGGSDEEPDEAQTDLMRRTASHIISSPNPAQLEMRILTNYGADKRFAFLRGRWSRVWRTEKERARQHQAEEAKKIRSQTALTSLGGLAGYGDSDADSEESTDKPIEEPGDAADAPCTQGGRNGEDAVKEARRARAKEWSARRRAGQSELQSEKISLEPRLRTTAQPEDI